ncbi:MAG: hypothetical protein ACKV19_20735 [Verrucomicrobiales bacterium]
MNGWSLERRRRQSLLIQTWQPWNQSTGPRTPEGKARSSKNADKGRLRQKLRNLRWLLRQIDEDQIEVRDQ